MTIMQKEFKVDFMCVGAAKCGTTWLYQMLNQHPDIFIPDCKEVHYFNAFHPETLKPNLNNKHDLTWYHHHFQEALPHQLKGDFSTTYFRELDTATTLKAYHQDLKIIVILRNPVERAWSHFQFLYTRGGIKQDNFFKAIEEVPSIITIGKYHQLLECYAQYFDSNQLKIMLYEELQDPSLVLTSLIQFLDLPHFSPKGLHDRINSTGQVINKTSHKIVTSFRHSKIGKKVNRSIISKALNHFHSKNSRIPVQKEAIPTDVQDFLKEYYYQNLKNIRQITIPTSWY